MSKRYLVTGGSGFIGSSLVRRLVAAGHSVRSLDDNTRGVVSRLDDMRDDVEVVNGDVRDAGVVRRATEGMDGVFHLAFVNGTEFFYSKPEVVLDVGVRGMLNVLDACKRCDVGELILASSSEVYQTPEHCPTDETVALSVPDVLNPRYSYGGGKIISELLAINYGRKGFDRVMIFRPHNVYGPDMGWEHVIPQLVVRAVERIAATPTGVVDFPIQGDGSQTRSFIHIDDFTAGVLAILERGKHLNIYHIGTEEEVSIRDLATRIVSHFGREARIVEGALPAGGTLRRCPDITKLRALGFEPRISLDGGLAPVAEWYAAHKNEA